LSSARILAVDDERATGEALSEMLSQWGHRVETAFDGNDALKKAMWDAVQASRPVETDQAEPKSV